ncbi:MAG: alpha/beta hydrolase [Thermoplasmata archaeon]
MGEYLDANGLRTYFERRGSGDPVLLLHGGGGTAESLTALADILAEHYEVLIPERRWHARTACVGKELTYEVMAEDTIAFMDRLGVTDAHLIGQSDGANVALLTAVQRPDHVRKLVLMGGNFNTDYLSSESRAWLKGLSPEIARQVFPSVVDLYFNVTPDAEARFPVLLQMLGNLYASDWRIPTMSLEGVATKTLVMAGDRDSVPIAHTLELFRSIPNAQLCVVPEADHEFARKKPELIGPIIVRFLGS